ncbi:MAG TPA: hypothetical protein VIK53_04570 [Verrucomicrobiae bacterium]
MRYLVTILFVLVVLVGCSRKPDISQRDPQREQRDMILHAEMDALYAKTVLTALRDGQQTNALEFLEMQIDTSVILIDHSLTNRSGSDRDGAMSTLRLLKAYREAYPRKQEAVLPSADKQDAETLIQGRRDATRILNDLK